VLLSEKLPDSVTGSTIARYCASSLNAIRIAADSVRAGDGDTYIAAGVESVSRAGPNSEATLPDTQNPKLQGKDGTHNAYIAMGETAENVAERYGVKREDMDEYAKRSQDLAVESQENGFFEREIIPLENPDGSVVSKDDGPRAGTTVEKLATLKPVFREDGSVTAGNSCPLNDGAAATLIMSEERANELGLKPRARIIASATAGNEPEYMGVAPIGAIRNVLQRAGMSIGDIDVVELNEAFASQALAVLRDLGLPDDAEHVNPHGGAIALGHPLGMTGARLALAAARELGHRDARRAVATMCIGVGQGISLLLER
jgi:acetyl-CoA C-acetyltransferase